MRILLLILFITVSLLANIGKVFDIKGEAYINRGAIKLPLSVDFIIKKEDTIVTKNFTKVKIKFNDNTLITIGKNSEFSIKEYSYDTAIPKSSKAYFKFGAGVFKIITGTIGKVNPNKFKLRTKSCTLGIRGTEIFLRVIKNFGDIVACRSGRIWVKSNYTNKMVNLDFKFITFIRIGEDPSTPVKYNEKDVDELDDSRFKIIDNFEFQFEKANEQYRYYYANESSKVTDEDNQVPEEIRQRTSRGDIRVLRFMPSDTSRVDIAQDDANESPEENNNEPQEENEQDEESDEPTDEEENEPASGTYEVSGFENEPEIQTNIAENIEETFITTSGDIISLNDLIQNPPDLENLPQYDKEIVGSDNFMEYGFWLENNGRFDTFISGDITPSSIVDDYIQSSGTTASYSGNIAAIITNPNGTKDSSIGDISLNINFSNQNLNGNLKINEGNWQASINSGDVNEYGFDSNDISTSGGDVENISGSLNGDFYGIDANSVGGTFELESTNDGSVEGSFGGVR